MIHLYCTTLSNTLRTISPEWDYPVYVKLIPVCFVFIVICVLMQLTGKVCYAYDVRYRNVHNLILFIRVLPVIYIYRERLWMRCDICYFF
jgi:hypothetical protein